MVKETGGAAFRRRRTVKPTGAGITGTGRGAIMGQPVVHFEIIGTDPAGLRGYYGDLFGWEFDTSGPVAKAVSQPDDYGFTEPSASGGTAGIPGGVGGGASYHPHVVFYVGVPDVEAALRKAESLGGKRVMGPERAPGRDLVVGHFTDPEGNLIGLAGPA
jgi:predicted enzyme related to lactoylglutathione lyase